jgi:hypothetical protein
VKTERRDEVDNEDRALKGTQYTWFLWQVVYVSVAFAFLIRALNLWGAFLTGSYHWWHAVGWGGALLMTAVPLIMGLAFRKVLKGELAKETLNARTYRICDFWIAQLLLYAYIALITYPILLRG